MKRYLAGGLTLALFATAALAAVFAFGADPSSLLALFTDPHTAGGLVLANAVGGLELKEVQKAIEKIGGEIKEMAEKAIAEAKKGIDMSTSAKDKADDLLTKQTELTARVQELEQKADQRGSKGEPDEKTPGQALTESEDFKSWIKAGGMKSANSGFVFGVKAITSVSGSGAAGVAPDRSDTIVTPPLRRLTIRDLITPGRTESNLVQYVRETGFTNAAATVAEGTLKPESTITYDLMQSAVVTIAHWIKASKQILDDFKALQSNIDGRLRYGLKLVEEAQLLKGSGSGNNLNGLYTQATAYAAPITIAGATRIDTLRLMLLQADLAEYPSTGIVLHPSDWAAIELTKDSMGGYIFANPQRLATPSLWGRDVVPTQAMTVNTALVGAFQLGAQVFDREDATVVVSTENQDDFIKNMVTIRAEERLALADYRPEAFVKNAALVAP